MVEENILFCYMLTDAWGLRLTKVTVFKDGKVQYKDGKRKESCCKLNVPSLKQIEEILKQHAVIFEYTSSENILNHDVVPVKAINVVKTFDEIAEILVKNGVDSKCLRLTYQ